MDETVDVLVVGAGPSGSLAARELARTGASVLLVDRAHFPRWKVCGGCVGPAALASLKAVGLGDLPARDGAIQLKELVLVGPGGGRARLGLPGGVAWSRSAMDAALVAEARGDGAEVRTGVRAELGGSEDGRRLVRLREVTGGATWTVGAGLVLDASGLGGAPEVGGGAGAEQVDADARVGLGALLSGDALMRSGGEAWPVPQGRIVMVVGRLGYVGLVRLEDGTLDVAAAVDPEALRGGTPESAVAAILADAGYALRGTPVNGWRGTPPLTRAPCRAAGDRCLRLGDALGYVEPFTGEGMGWALASARAVQPLAARALEGWDASVAADWEAYRSGSAARSRRLCRAVAWGLRRPGLVRAVVSALRGAPWLATPFLDAVCRVPTPPSVGRSARLQAPRAALP